MDFVRAARVFSVIEKHMERVNGNVSTWTTLKNVLKERIIITVLPAEANNLKHLEDQQILLQKSWKFFVNKTFTDNVLLKDFMIAWVRFRNNENSQEIENETVQLFLREAIKIQSDLLDVTTSIVEQRHIIDTLCRGLIGI